MRIQYNLLFEKISADNIMKILECSNGHIKHYNRGDMIFKQGEEPHVLFMLLEGKVRLTKNLFSGKKRFLSEISDGTIFGEDCFLGDRGVYICDAEAASHTVTLEVPWQYFYSFCDNMCDHHKQIIKNMFGILSDKEMRAMKKITMVTPTSLRERIANWMLDCLEDCGEYSSSVETELSREELADFLGVARPSLSRAMMKLQEEGLIKIEGKKITVVDRDALENMAR